MRYYSWVITAALVIFICALLQIPFTHTASSQLSSCANLDSTFHRITISCGIFGMTDLAANLSNTTAIKQVSPGIWLLDADIVINQNGTLLIDSKDVKWLKISSPYGIQVLGNLVIDSTMITGWDNSTGTYAMTNGVKPRAYLFVSDHAIGQMNITNSEIAYMGYANFENQGISYLGGSGSILKNNNIHDMWYGFYSQNVKNMIIEYNIVHDNAFYGLDPHSGTSNMTIRFNQIYNIEKNIGIICSFYCNNIMIENNTVYDVADAGIMLSEFTTNSTIRNNSVYNSATGISLYNHTGGINVNDNLITNTLRGIKLEVNSSNNFITNNTVTNSTTFGICQDVGSKNNTISTNQIINSVTPICAQKSYQQLILSNTIENRTSAFTPGSSDKIPSWVKNNAKWWSENQMGDAHFLSGIQYLIKQGIIEMPTLPTIPSQTLQQIPTWMKNTAGWWADGLISDDEFVNSVQYLISTGIVKV